MFAANRIAPVLALLFLALILTQCSRKEDGDPVRLGIKYTQEQKYDRAMDAFLEAIELQPRNSEAYYGLGGIYNFKQRHEEAREAFLKAIRYDPTHFNAHYSLGYTYELLGDKEKAETEYAKYRKLKGRFDALMKQEKESG